MSTLHEKILKASLIHIRTHGFTQRAINEGCHFVNISPGSSKIFVNGELELVNHILDQAYFNSLSNMDTMDIPANANSNVNKAKLSQGLKEYINTIGLYVDHWDQAMMLLSRPHNLQSSFSKIWGFSDELYSRTFSNEVSGFGISSPFGNIIYFFYDLITNIDSLKQYWHRKNLCLLIMLSEVYLLTDKSRDFEASMEFIDRRIDNLETLEQYASMVGPTLQGVNIGLMSLLDIVKKPPKF